MSFQYDSTRFTKLLFQQITDKKEFQDLFGALSFYALYIATSVISGSQPDERYAYGYEITSSTAFETGIVPCYLICCSSLFR